MIKSYKDLKVWEKAMNLVEDIYKITTIFPDSEKYGITSQIRRSAVSVPSNIAEGHTRGFLKEYINFTYYSLGSLAELETQIMLAERLKYIDNAKEVLDKCDELGKMIRGLQISLSKNLEDVTKIKKLEPIT